MAIKPNDGERNVGADREQQREVSTESARAASPSSGENARDDASNAGSSPRGRSNRGFASMDRSKQRELASKGGYWLIPDKLHESLEQGYIITKRAAANPLARKFDAYIGNAHARATMVKYGFVLPGEAAGR